MSMEAFRKAKEGEIDALYEQLSNDLAKSLFANGHDLTPGPPLPWYRVLRWRISGLVYRIGAAWRVLTGKADISDD